MTRGSARAVGKMTVTIPAIAGTAVGQRRDMATNDYTEEFRKASARIAELIEARNLLATMQHNSASEVDRLRQRVEKLERQNERLADDANRELSLWNDERKRAERLEAKRVEDGKWIRAATSDAVAQRIRAVRLEAALREIGQRDCYGEPCDCGEVAGKALAGEA